MNDQAPLDGGSAAAAPPQGRWQGGDQHLTWQRHALVMGIVNVTPDSFFDGGRYVEPSRAIAHGAELARAGARILDVGGASTRPGAQPVPPDVQIARVIPVLRGLRSATDALLSIDTSSAVVADAALAEGAAIVNDVTAAAGDPDMLALLARSACGVVLMHMQGTPRSMQLAPTYRDVVAEVGPAVDLRDRHHEAVARCEGADVEERHGEVVAPR